MSGYPYLDEIKKAIGAYGFSLESMGEMGTMKMVPVTPEAIKASAGLNKWCFICQCGLRLENWSVASWADRARQLASGEGDKL